jgi:hypothetical protein
MKFSIVLVNKTGTRAAYQSKNSYGCGTNSTNSTNVHAVPKQ